MLVIPDEALAGIRIDGDSGVAEEIKPGPEVGTANGVAAVALHAGVRVRIRNAPDDCVCSRIVGAGQPPGSGEANLSSGVSPQLSLTGSPVLAAVRELPQQLSGFGIVRRDVAVGVVAGAGSAGDDFVAGDCSA